MVLFCGVMFCSAQKRSRMPTPNSPREPFFPEIGDDGPGGPGGPSYPSANSGEYTRRHPSGGPGGPGGGSSYQPSYNSNYNPPASFPQGDFRNTGPPHYDTRAPAFSPGPAHYSPGSSYQSGPQTYQGGPPPPPHGYGAAAGGGGSSGPTPGYSYTPGPSYTTRGPSNSYPPSSPQSYSGPPQSYNSGPPPQYNSGPPPSYDSGPPPSYGSGPQQPYNAGPPQQYNSPAPTHSYLGSGPPSSFGPPGPSYSGPGPSPHSFRRDTSPFPPHEGHTPASTHSYNPAPYEKPGPAPAYHGGGPREERNDGNDFRAETTPAQQLEQGLGGLPQFDDFLKDLGFNNQGKSNAGPAYHPQTSPVSGPQPGYFQEQPSSPDTQYAPGKEKEPSNGFVPSSPPNFRSAFSNDEEALGFTPAQETEPLYNRQSSSSVPSSRAKDSNSKGHTCRKVNKRFDPGPFGTEDDKGSRSKRSPVMTCFQCEAADGRFYEQCSYGEEETKPNPDSYFRAHEESYDTYRKPKKEKSSTRTRRDSDMNAEASEDTAVVAEPQTEREEDEQQISETQDNQSKSDDEPEVPVIPDVEPDVDFNVPKETVSFEGTLPTHSETFAGLPTPSPFDHRDYFRQLFPEFRTFEEESKAASEPHTREDSSFFNPPEFAGAEAFRASSTPDREVMSFVADVEGRTQGDQKGCEKHVRGSAICMVCTDDQGNAREECALQENGPTSRRLAFHSAQEYRYVPTTPSPSKSKSSFRSGALSRKSQDSALGASNARAKNFFEDFFRPSIFA